MTNKPMRGTRELHFVCRQLKSDRKKMKLTIKFEVNMSENEVNFLDVRVSGNVYNAGNVQNT